MRENKLRVWDNERKMFVPQGEVTFHFYGETRWSVSPNCIEYIHDPCHYNAPSGSRFVIEWFTGLKDKNGVEIYEGDVNYDRDYDCYAVIEFDEKSLQWVVMLYGYRMHLGEGSQEVFDNIRSVVDTIALCDFENLCIIGNIHDNPELIS